jgi:hypothetical protein
MMKTEKSNIYFVAEPHLCDAAPDETESMFLGYRFGV